MKTIKDISHYPVLGRLFREPSADLIQTGEQTRVILEKYDPELLCKIDLFSDYLKGKTLAELRECYSVAFSVPPCSTLDIGSVLYGDEYRRGVFHVNMQREHINAGNDLGKELPDHLPDVLNLLPKISDEEFALELVRSFIIPALAGMISRFRKRDNPYKTLLEILLDVMKEDFEESTANDRNKAFKRSHADIIPCK